MDILISVVAKLAEIVLRDLGDFLFRKRKNDNFTQILNLSENINSDVEKRYQGNSILHLAVKYEHWTTVEDIFKTGPSLVLLQNRQLDVPLHIAARLGRENVSTLLINKIKEYQRINAESGIKDPFQKLNSLGNTALHEAVRYGHDNIAASLIKEDPNSTSLTNAARESPLFMAVDRKFHSIAFHILETCPDNILETCVDSAFFQGRSGMNAMHAAVIGLPLQNFLRKLLTKCGSGILNKKDDFGWLPLHYAACMGNVEIVKLFLTENIDLAYVGDKEGMSALHIAAREGRISVIRTLVEVCPFVCELLDNRNRTALHVAVESGKKNVVKTLLNMREFRYLIDEKDEDGNVRHVLLIMLATDGRVEKVTLNKMGMTAVDIINSNTRLEKVAKAFMISMLEKKGYTPSLERRILVRETMSVDEKMEGHERSEQTTQRLKMPAKDEAVASVSRAANTARENNKEKHHATPNYDPGKHKPYEHIRNIGNINLLVATIIASITFAAAMQIPGGNDSNGMANLRTNTDFKIFVLADSVAFGCATASMFIHFAVAFCAQILQETYTYPINCVMFLTIISIVSSVVAFIKGAEMVFKSSSRGGSDVGPPVYVASLSFLIPVFYFLFRLVKVGQRLVQTFILSII
ncbi:hypothetical protein FNV43_RR16426 [Rhamnella rubrinervis]|uniref:PGG domain-containing protein n=1 Tax=Rhamnella rubrinervis TaxID=2594499 RepID=A0A8K0GYS6_9ROSA|nr:hypothetical protein FNV43_RR16426 [Rhamnella rubrinervis]